MLKYLYCKEIFKEVPGEITLGISISGCQIRCKGCHSRELWEDKGKPLTWDSLNALINIHHGITCVCLFGGEHDLDALTDLFYHTSKYVKTAWYSGLDMVPKNHLGILEYLDYIKLGHYDMELGGLDSPDTNQRLYKVNKGELEDITIKLQT
jgi:anaerobic ribonucleoside-triphosphate reductase activating protein